MSSHHFISYSKADAKDFAFYIASALEAESPNIKVWLDERDLKPGQDWDEQVDEAISSCQSLLFVMTKDSADKLSETKKEWTRALKYKKPIIPILRHYDAQLPFRLEPRQYIDFTSYFDAALDNLKKHFAWLTSPEGILNNLKDRMADARRDLRRAKNQMEKNRIEDEIDELSNQITDQEKIVADPQAAARRVEESIARGIEREQKPKRPVSGVIRTKFINSPPIIAPTYFQNRYVETKMIGDFLKDDALRFMTVVGRAGIGKTAMVCRLLKSLESGQLPDDGGRLKVDGIIYLSESGSHKVNFSNLFISLCQLLPRDIAKSLEQHYKNPKVTTADKTNALLSEFPEGKVLLLLDNFEDKINHKTRDIVDTELNDSLKALLNHPHHAVKVILTTRISPRQLALTQPSRYRTLDLEAGLESPFAENILREMDVDGRVGLKEAPDDLLDEARQRTRGYPRALEALFAILSADRETSLQELLHDTEKFLPEYVVEKLVGEAFNRLDQTAQMVMQALAIYGHPVPPVAIDYLLEPYLTGVDSAPVLNNLVNRKFVRREAARYYLHPVDRAYALSRIAVGIPLNGWEVNADSLNEFFEEYSVSEGDEKVPSKNLVDAITDQTEELYSQFTQFALFHRGAEFFRNVRLPRENWNSIADLTAQLLEFDLRCSCQDHNTAAQVLLEIDFDYLLLWGHYRLTAELHERLQGRINDPFLKQASAGNLGTAYNRIGHVHRAAELYDQALEIARENGDRSGVGTWLGNLGQCLATIGQTTQAVEQIEKALDIAREVGDRSGEGTWLGNIGQCLATIGQTTQAVEQIEKALDIAREVGNRSGEGTWLGALGGCYETLGKTERAIEHYQQALDIAREVGERSGEGTWLGALGGCYETLGKTERAIEHYQQALDIAREVGNRSGEGTWLGALGGCYVTLGKTERAIEHYQQALDIAREVGERSGEGTWLGALGGCYVTLGKTERAIEHYQQALDIAREVGNRSGEGTWLGALGGCYVTLGKTERAIEHYQQALDIAREVGERSGEGTWLGALGGCYETLGKTERAIEHYQQALDIAREVGNRSGEGTWLGALGGCYVTLGKTERAIELYQQALDIAREVGNRSGEGTWLGALGGCYVTLGKTERAIEHYQQALDIAREVGERSGEGSGLGALGGCYVTLGKTERAIEHYQQALDIAREVGERSGEGTWLGALGGCYETLGKTERAIEHYQQALDIAREVGNRSGEGTWLGALGGCYVTLGKTERAIEHYQQALDIAREVGERSGEGTWLGALGGCYETLGKTERAIEHYQQALDIAREVGDRSGEGTWLGNIGQCLATIGQTTQAVEQIEKALDIAREVGNRSGEGSWLGALGGCFAHMGQYDRAVENHKQALNIFKEVSNRIGEAGELGNLGVCYYYLGQAKRVIYYYEQALIIAREIGDRGAEGTWLGNLGDIYDNLGNTTLAIEYLKQSLAIAREIGDRFEVAWRLGNLSEVMIGEGRYDEAIQYAADSLNIGEEIGAPSIVSCSGKYLALAHFYSGNISAARSSAEMAQKYNIPDYNHGVILLLGIISISENDLIKAREIFFQALDQADLLITSSALNYEALDTKGLSLCGLALCEGDHHITAAIKAFSAARKINSDSGVESRVLRLFDSLIVADKNCLLPSVRPAAAGNIAQNLSPSQSEGL